MTFTPKVWTNGTLVDATAMIDLETRVAAYADVTPSLAFSRRYQAQMAAEGYYAETLPRAAAIGTPAILISGTVYYVNIGLLAGDVVTNLHTLVSVLGSGFSGIGMKLGLYDKTGALLRATGDISAAHASTGPKVNALSSPYTILSTDSYFLAMLCIATTPPTLAKGALSSVFSGAFTGGVGMAASATGLTDFLSNVTYVYSGSNHAWWIGVS